MNDYNTTALRFFSFCAKIKDMKIMKITKSNTQLLVKKVSKVIRNNRVVILPFDTVYGYACNPKSDETLGKIFELKERNINKTIGAAVCGIETLEQFSEINETVKQFIEEKTPGKYTFIVKAKLDHTLSKYCIKDDTIGIRIPESDFILDIIRSSGGIVAQTSANKSGMPDCYSINELLTQYSKDELERVDLIIDGGELEKSGLSQIFDLTGSEPAEIERK